MIFTVHYMYPNIRWTKNKKRHSFKINRRLALRISRPVKVRGQCAHFVHPIVVALRVGTKVPVNLGPLTVNHSHRFPNESHVFEHFTKVLEQSPAIGAFFFFFLSFVRITRLCDEYFLLLSSSR